MIIEGIDGTVRVGTRLQNQRNKNKMKRRSLVLLTSCCVEFSSKYVAFFFSNYEYWAAMVRDIKLRLNF